jgi:putative transposase
MTHDGRMLRMLTLIDEYTRESLAIRVARRLGSYEVIEALADVMLLRGVPEHIRSDNGPEFVAKELRDECLNGEIFWRQPLVSGSRRASP